MILKAIPPVIKSIIVTFLMTFGFLLNISAQTSITDTIYPKNEERWTGTIRYNWILPPYYSDILSDIRVGDADFLGIGKLRGWTSFNLQEIPDSANISDITLYTYTNEVGGDNLLININDLTIDPISANNEDLFYEIGGAFTFFSQWNAMQDSGIHSIQLGPMACDLMKNHLSINIEWWGVGFIADDESINHGQFDGYLDDQLPFCAVTYTLPSTLNANFAADDTTIFVDESVQFTDSSTSTGNPIISWEWTFEEGNPPDFYGQFPPLITYNTAGDFYVTLTVFDGTNSHTETKPNYIHVTDPNINQLEITNYLTIYADDIQELEPGLWEATGEVNINDILHYGGNVVVDMNGSTPTVGGDCEIFLEEIPDYGTITLYDGIFNFQAADSTLNDPDINSLVGTLNYLAGLPVNFNNGEITVLSTKQGVELSGELEFPDMLGNLSINIDALQISKNYGVEVEISVGDIEVYNTFDIGSLFLKFDTGDDYFFGEGLVQTSKFGVGANAEVMGGQLNSVHIFFDSCQIPLGTSGFDITYIDAGVDNLAQPPMIFSIIMDIEPQLTSPLPVDDIVVLNDLGLSYTWGTSFEGSGNLFVFNKELAYVWLFINSNKIEFSGGVNLYNVLLGNINTSLYKLPDGIDFQGNLYAALQIPDKTGFPFWLIGSFVDLPYTVAETDNYLHNNKIGGNFSIFSFNGHYLLTWENSNLYLDLGLGYENWNEILFNKNYLMYDQALNQQNRFEGKSLMLSNSYLNPSASADGSILTQSFIISSLTPAMITRVQDIIAMPQYSITTPSNVEILPSNVSQFPNVSYVENTEVNMAYYIIKNPELGEWIINIDDNGDTVNIDIFGAYNPPFIQLESIQKVGNTVIISWTDSDIDSDAEIYLYVDNDNQGANGLPLNETVISEDELTDNYFWNNCDTLPTGNYYVYAVIKDNDTMNVPNISYSPNSITIVQDSAPAAPTDLTGFSTDSAIVLLWSDPNPGNLRHIVYYSENPALLNYKSSSFNVGRANTFNFKNFLPGKQYYFFVTCLDSLYRQSEASNVFDIYFSSDSLNNAPNIFPQTFPNIAFVDSLYQYQVIYEDIDDNTLEFEIYCLFLDSLPNHVLPTINDTGLIKWIPSANEIGVHQISIKVTDPDSLYDSVAFTLTVFDTINYDPIIQFNKPKYTCYDDEAFITIKDVIIPDTIDAISFTIHSKAEPSGVELEGIETQPDSKEFLSSVILSENISGNGYLKVFSNDSIWIIYQTTSNFCYFEYNDIIVPIYPQGNTVFCEGENVEVELIADTGYIHYLWSDLTIYQNIIVTDTGGYYVTVIDSLGCTYQSDTINVYISEPPQLELGDDTTACDSVLLDGQNPTYFFQWSTGDTTQTITVTQNGLYSLIVTDTNSCTNSDSIFVTILPSTNVDLGNDTVACGSIELNSNIPNAQNLWNTGATTSSIIATQSGLYWVQITNNYGCISSDSINVTIHPVPEVDLGPDAIYCYGDSINAGNNGCSFLWNTGDTVQVIYPELDGIYAVMVTSPEGCINSDSVYIVVQHYAEAAFDFSDSLLTVQFINLSNNGESYIWHFGDGFQSYEYAPVHTYAIDSTYLVELIVINNCNVDTSLQLVTVSSLGIQDEMLERLLKVYPNPFNNQIIFMLSSPKNMNVSIMIRDIHGNLLLQDKLQFTKNEPSKSINLESLSKGIYFLVIKAGKAMTVKKIIKN